ncbi:hypothetical protein TNCT_521031 [Trichonephila clavata]|uniref:Uncharacterized protein n=1 Tax=Trichonephila clavata TaxID=2740835 RepID=A0A8X6LQW0_TRICU|nr:hypothetical protein TNCT_521031 [Trichonephila clavata]
MDDNSAPSYYKARDMDILNNWQGRHEIVPFFSFGLERGSFHSNLRTQSFCNSNLALVKFGLMNPSGSNKRRIMDEASLLMYESWQFTTVLKEK